MIELQIQDGREEYEGMRPADADYGADIEIVVRTEIRF